MTNDSLWSGPFGNDYVLRNRNAGANRGPFWQSLIARRNVTSVLEVGCNTGANLVHIAPLVPDTAGCDVNNEALFIAHERLGDAVPLYVRSATNLSFDFQWDLVLTSGVLIHVSPDDLGKAIDELVRVARRYVLVIEYYAPIETVVPYRGQEAALWKRDYGRVVAERHPELTLIEQGPLGPPEWEDTRNYWMWTKP